MGLSAAATCRSWPLRSRLQKRLDVRISRRCRRSPRQAALKAGTVGLVEGPELMLGHHRDGREHHRAVPASLDTERLAREPLAQGDLTALADDLDFDVIRNVFSSHFHAIMLSCHHAVGYPAAGAGLKTSGAIVEPALQFAVELSALVVEAVRQLVADRGADAAEVHGFVRRPIEERRLQDAGGKDDLGQLRASGATGCWEVRRAWDCLRR